MLWMTADGIMIRVLQCPADERLMETLGLEPHRLKNLPSALYGIWTCWEIAEMGNDCDEGDKQGGCSDSSLLHASFH